MSIFEMGVAFSSCLALMLLSYGSLALGGFRIHKTCRDRRLFGHRTVSYLFCSSYCMEYIVMKIFVVDYHVINKLLPNSYLLGSTRGYMIGVLTHTTALD